MNKTILHGKQRRVRGNLKVKLAKFTDDDRRLLDGKIDQMVGILQERYGFTQQSASKALSHYLGGYSKRREHRVAGFARGWPLVVSVMGLFGLIMAGRFALARVMSKRQEASHKAGATQEPLADPDIFSS